MADNLNYSNPGSGSVVAFEDVSSVFYQRCFVGGWVAHDTAAAASIRPVLMGGYASASAPTSVNADGDAVQAWFLKNGAQVVTLTAGDSLIQNANGVYQQGGTAHDGVDAGNPVKVGFRAVALGSSPTSVAAADRTDALATRAGQLFAIGGHPNVVTTRANYTSSQTDVVVGPTNSTGTRMVVTAITVTADNANTVSPSVILGFGSTNTPTGDGVVLAHPGLPGGGGVSRGSGSGILGIGGDGEELRITCGAPTSGSLTVVVTYFLIS